MAEERLSQPLDIMSSRETQLSILVPYLESVANGNDTDLAITVRTLTLIQRCLIGWHGLFKFGHRQKPVLTPEGAFLYYLKLKEQDAE